ncbi:hypothetical protein [Polaribacter sp.]|uniref:hypothetical protein n=1 Tax=Polaribacter sp. TaxID=1920175 RepID=UPI003F6B4C48
MIFIYAKDKKIKCLTHTESLERNKQLLSVGYIHTATLDPCRFLEHLHNNDLSVPGDLFNSVKDLSKT